METSAEGEGECGEVLGREVLSEEPGLQEVLVVRGTDTRHSPDEQSGRGGSRSGRFTDCLVDNPICYPKYLHNIAGGVDSTSKVQISQNPDKVGKQF